LTPDSRCLYSPVIVVPSTEIAVMDGGGCPDRSERMETNLTVSELAAFITPSSDSDEIARVTRRLRHLTEIGALDTAGEVHTGAGRHRIYGPDSTAAAAVLVALGDMGLPVGILKQAAFAIRVTMLPMPPGMAPALKHTSATGWKAAVAGEPMLLGLAVAARADGEPTMCTVFLVPPGDFKPDRVRFGGASGLIILDLQHVFRATNT
jgi:hypothetical protein